MQEHEQNVVKCTAPMIMPCGGSPCYRANPDDIKKFALEEPWRPRGEQRYSSTHSLTSALDGGGWLTPCPSRFTPGNDSSGPQGRSGRVPGNLAPTGIRPPDRPPVASRYILIKVMVISTLYLRSENYVSCFVEINIFATKHIHI
jgi:hypothetical protein